MILGATSALVFHQQNWHDGWLSLRSNDGLEMVPSWMVVKSRIAKYGEFHTTFSHPSFSRSFIKKKYQSNSRRPMEILDVFRNSGEFMNPPLPIFYPLILTEKDWQTFHEYCRKIILELRPLSTVVIALGVILKLYLVLSNFKSLITPRALKVGSGKSWGL